MEGCHQQQRQPQLEQQHRQQQLSYIMPVRQLGQA
jgi:hypothetical protein